MEHQVFDSPPLAGFAASARRIGLATLAVIGTVIALGAVAYAVGRWL